MYEITWQLPGYGLGRVEMELLAHLGHDFFDQHVDGLVLEGRGGAFVHIPLVLIRLRE